MEMARLQPWQDRKCRSQRDYAPHASPADDKRRRFAWVAIVRHADKALHKHRDINGAIRCHEADNDEHGSDQNATCISVCQCNTFLK